MTPVMRDAGWFIMLLMVVGTVLGAIVLGHLVWSPASRGPRAAPVRQATMVRRAGTSLGADGHSAEPA